MLQRWQVSTIAMAVAFGWPSICFAFAVDLTSFEVGMAMAINLAPGIIAQQAMLEPYGN